MATRRAVEGRWLPPTPIDETWKRKRKQKRNDDDWIRVPGKDVSVLDAAVNRSTGAKASLDQGGSSAWRPKLARLVESNAVQTVIIALIALNAITLGLETSRTVMREIGPLLVALDHIFLTVFVVEIALRIAAHGLRFFRDPWSVFDFLVVGIALAPATGELSVLRALRILRVLRLLSVVPQMRRVVGALLSSVPGLAAIGVILLLLYYVFAVIATNLFAEHFPQWFGSLGASMYTLFEIMTLEGWAQIARDVMQVFPYAWVFFVLYILVATFTMLNLFIGIIVSAIEAEHQQEMEQAAGAVTAAKDEAVAAIHADVQALRQELRELSARLKERAE
jgi:voltage-gated sodium channel